MGTFEIHKADYLSAEGLGLTLVGKRGDSLLDTLVITELDPPLTELLGFATTRFVNRPIRSHDCSPPPVPSQQLRRCVAGLQPAFFASLANRFSSDFFIRTITNSVYRSFAGILGRPIGFFFFADAMTYSFID
jgi:hypothetical protein